MPVTSIRPAAVNDKIYTPVDTDCADFYQFASALAETIRAGGVRSIDPIVVSQDDVIISGHRRYAFYRARGYATVFVQHFPVRSDDPQFQSLLVRYNSQRSKSADELFREELVRLNPVDAHRRLVAHRAEAARVKVETMEIGGAKVRPEISKAKLPLVRAIQKVVTDLEDFWPLSARGIFYQLLNDPPLIHASKPKSRYRNDQPSYDALEILTRMRLEDLIPMESIGDETRPVVTWDVFPSVQGFIRRELAGFLKQYQRDLQRTQPLHIEIIGEKNTVEGVIRPVAGEYGIPFTIGRGYSSLPPRWQMAQRYKKSGKEGLLILAVCDADPEGDDIPVSFAKSMRNDFGIGNIDVVKAALTHDQAAERGLPRLTVAKKDGSRRKAFVERHGSEFVWELEALHPTALQDLLRVGIESVMDMGAYRAQLAAEATDAARLEAIRGTMKTYLVKNFAEMSAGAAEGGAE